MAETQVKFEEGTDIEPIETTSTELMKVINEGDPDLQLAILEKKATLAPRFKAAVNTILVTQTFPEDWVEQGEGDKAMMCLKSAGTERVARLFDIKFFEVKCRKEDFTDSVGKAYRYVYEGKAAMANRIIFAQGVYGTRDKFLGFAKGDWRPVEDVNENNIRNAAYHIFLGNGIKGLLGLRGMPKREWLKIMGKAGEDANKASAVSHSQGTQGGTSADDAALQKQLGELLVEMAQAMYMIEIDDEGKHGVTMASEVSDVIEVAKASCKALTSFKGKDNKIVSGLDSAKAVKGKRLEIALKNAQKLWAEVQQS